MPIMVLVSKAPPGAPPGDLWFWRSEASREEAETAQVKIHDYPNAKYVTIMVLVSTVRNTIV